MFDLWLVKIETFCEIREKRSSVNQSKCIKGTHRVIVPHVYTTAELKIKPKKFSQLFHVTTQSAVLDVRSEPVLLNF